MLRLFLIGARSLLTHRVRTFLLGAAISFVTALLLALTGISVGVQETMIRSATTLMTGHVNIGGFYKVTAGQSAPVVTQAAKLLELVEREVPELDYVAPRGRGWAKVISDTGSMQVGITGIEIAREPGLRQIVVVEQGSIDDLAKPNSMMIFAEQAKKLEVKVGDKLTVAAPTFRGVNNTADVTVVAIARNMGLFSSWSTFMDEPSLRALYQLNADTTGALQLYLKDRAQVSAVQERLRKKLVEAGWAVMDPNPQPFWMKFPSVNREDWTGQKLDVTSWEDEISFMKWIVSLLAVLGIAVTLVLMVIISIGIMNVMWISIRERTREIGTLRAIGMQRTGVLTMFVVEAFLLGAAGTAVGAMLGLVVARALNAAHIEVPVGAQMFLMNDHLVVTPTVGWVVFAMLFITGCITAVSLIPSFLAARMKPITAMHHIG